ncbi:MAG: HIT domain-containing protein [Candidatus Saccharibacteria bacterium]|nr:HIT domain-containing protein [Candidatus Saccharibacteria bacterium]
MSSVFDKIVKGEIPCYKIYEDEKTLAFLDIEPVAVGHTLVIPKVEVDKLYELSDEDYEAVMRTVKRVAKRMDEVLGKRIFMKVIGTDVPHAHVHLIPQSENYVHGEHVKMSESEMEEVRAKLAF